MAQFSSSVDALPKPPTDTTAWTQNNCAVGSASASYSVADEVASAANVTVTYAQLNNGQHNYAASIVTNTAFGTAFPVGATIKAPLYYNGGADELCIGLQDGAQAPGAAGASILHAQSYFWGVGYSQYTGQCTLYWAGVGVASFGMSNISSTTFNELEVTFGSGANGIVVKQNGVTIGTFTMPSVPSITSYRYAISGRSGGTGATMAVGSYPQLAPAPLLTPETNGAYVLWPGAAPSYDYSVDGGSTWTTGVSSPLTISGLTAGTTYNFVLRANLSGGVSVLSKAIKFQPQPAYLVDNFTRADSSTSLGSPLVGGPYTAQSSTWGITGNKGYCASGAGKVTFPAASDIDMTFYSASSSGAGNIGMVFRWSGAGDFWQLYQGDGATWILQRFSGAFGRDNYKIPSPTGSVNNDYVRVVAVGNQIYVWINGSLRLNITDNYATGTLCGMTASAASGRASYLSCAGAPSFDLTGGVNGGNAAISDVPNDVAKGTGLLSAIFAYLGRDTKTADTGAP